MTIEILCADLRDVWAKFVGVMERNVFCKNRPHGGAIPGLSRNFEAEVHCWHPRSVCAKFRSNRTSGSGDYAFTDFLTDTHTDGHTHGRTRGKTESPHTFGLVETIIAYRECKTGRGLGGDCPRSRQNGIHVAGHKLQ